MIEHYMWEGKNEESAICICHLFRIIDKLGIVRFRSIAVRQSWCDDITLTIEYRESNSHVEQSQDHQVSEKNVLRVSHIFRPRIS